VHVHGDGEEIKAAFITNTACFWAAFT